MLDVGRETEVMGVEGGRWRVKMARPAGVGERYGVDVHLWWGMMRGGEQVRVAGGRRNKGMFLSD